MQCEICFLISDVISDAIEVIEDCIIVTSLIKPDCKLELIDQDFVKMIAFTINVDNGFDTKWSIDTKGTPNSCGLALKTKHVIVCVPGIHSKVSHHLQNQDGVCVCVCVSP